MKIINNLTNVNRARGRGGKIQWLVIHNTANGTSKEGTAKNNTTYFKNTMRSASAHYFIDDGAAIYRCVKDSDTAWHCGDGSSGPAGKKGCRNYNSIGIEVCEPKSGIFTAKEKETLRELVQHLMKTYGIKADHVVRHHDVSGKSCPWYYAKNDKAWNELHEYITGSKPAAKPASKTIKYRVKPIGAGWSVEKQNNQVAGTAGKDIGYIAISGVKKYRVKTSRGWLPWVTKYNINDLNYGCAGNGTPIYALEIADSSCRYAVNTKPGGWLPDMVGQKDTSGTRDTFAGNGKRIEFVRMKRV